MIRTDDVQTERDDVLRIAAERGRAYLATVSNRRVTAEAEALQELAEFREALPAAEAVAGLLRYQPVFDCATPLLAPLQRAADFVF